MKRFFSNLNPVQKKNVICAAVLAVMFIGLGAYAWWIHRPSPVTAHSMELTESVALESRMLVMGDIYWGRRMDDWARQSNLKEAYPFARLNEFQRDKYDTWVGNLECPSIPGVEHHIGFNPPTLQEFNCSTRYLPEAAKWFDVFSLANNHTSNQKREEGLELTRKQLNDHNIQYFGSFNPHVTEDVCEVVSVKARTLLDGKQQQIKLPIAMCGYHGAFYTITDKAMAEIKEYSKYMPTFAFPHLGREYQATPDEKRQNLYRTMIDNGADAVIGNHPHWVQPAEAYKGKPIFYSLGNFIFDQQFSDEVMRSALVAPTIQIAQGSVSTEQLRAWAALGETCGAFNDNCLQQAQKQQLQRLPITISYDIVASDSSNKMTKRANLRLYNDVLNRLNWSQVRTELTR